MFMSKRKNKSSILSIIIGFFLVILAFVSFGLSTYFGYKNYFKGANYDSSINIRYELDPYTVEDPTVPSQTPIDEKDLRDKLNKLADSYSQSLLDKNKTNSNVTTELYWDDDLSVYRAFIDANIYNYKLESSDPDLSKEDDKKVDVSPSLAYYQSMDAGRFNIIYSDGYNVNSSSNSEVGDGFKKARLYMWDLNQGDYSLTDSDNKIKNPSSSDINIQLRSKYSFGKKNGDQYTENSIKQTFYNAANHSPSQINDDKNDYPFMLIIHNLRGMINELNYITFVWTQHQDGHPYQDQVRTAYFQLTSDQIQFAEDISKARYTDNNGFIDNYTFDNNAGFQKNIEDPLLGNGLFPNPGDKNTFDSTNFFYFLQDQDSEGQPVIGKTSTLKYDFLSKYIMGVVTRDNYTDFLPDKNPEKTQIDSDGNWLVLKNLSNKYFTTNQIYKQMTSEKTSLPIMNVLVPSWSTDTGKKIDYILRNGITSNVNVSVINSDFDGSVLQIKTAIITTIVAIAVLLLIIGIVVSVLYRIPGFVSFAWLITPLGLMFLILFLSGFGLSLGLLVGVLITLIISSISLICILNRMKSQHVSHKTLDQSVNRAFSSSFLTTLDFHVIGFIAGVSMLFFPMAQIAALGLTLIVGSLLSFALVYGMNYLTQILIFKNNIGMYSFNWFSSKQYNINSEQIDPAYVSKVSQTVQRHIDNGINRNTYISRITAKNDVAFNWKWLVGYLSIALPIIIIGLILAFTVGSANLNGFYGGTRLMIQVKQGDVTVTWGQIMRALTLVQSNGWYNLQANPDYFVLETSVLYTLHSQGYDNLVNALQESGITAFFIQNISSKSTIEFTFNSLWVLLSFGGLMSVYSLIRYNWYSVLPTFVAFILTCLLTASFIVITHMVVNIYTNYTFIMLGIMCYLLMYSLMSSMLNRYVRRNPTLYTELGSLYIHCISLFNDNYVTIISLFWILSLVMILFLPSALIFMSLSILVGTIIMMFTTSIILPNFIYWFNNLHNMYRIRVRRIQSATEKRNLDKIDEELIDTININTRPREKD